MTIIEKEAIQKKIDEFELFIENVGATLDLQHGLVAEARAQEYNIDYKNVEGKKENARKLSKLERELSRMQKEYRELESQLDELKDQLTADDKEDKVEEQDTKDMERALQLAIKVWTNPQLKAFIKEMTTDLLSSVFEAVKGADLVTKVRMVTESVKVS